MNNKNLKIKNSILILPVLLLIILFELIPLFSIIVNGFFKENTHNFSYENFTSIFTRDYFTLSIKNSLYVSILSALIGIIVAFLCSMAIYNSKKSKIKKYFINILSICSNFQGIQLAFAFIIILGNSGIFVLLGKKFGIVLLSEFDLYTSFGIMLSFVFFQIPLGTLLLYPSFSVIKKEYIEAAELINVSGYKFWFKIGIPILMPSILGTFSVLFANALAAYATPYALMGNNYALLPIRISNMFVGDIIQQKELGSALSSIMLIIITLMSLISHKAAQKYRRGGKKE